jgi:hypothetical protein
MPTPPRTRDLDEKLRKIRDSRSEIEEPPTLREPLEVEDSKQVHVNVNLHAPDRRAQSSVPPKKEHPVKAILASDWVKLLGALLLGGAGSEAHHAVRQIPIDVASRSEVTEVNRELGKLEQKVTDIGHKVGELGTKNEHTKKQLYSVGRYTYRVLSKQGVAVYLERGTEEPPEMEFLPAPLDKVGHGDVHFIQPKESFPLPDRP